MKNTVFKFELLVDSQNRDAILLSLRNRMSSISGVLSTQLIDSDYGILFDVCVEFSDSEVAKKLHTKVMNILLKHEGVVISQATTKLTDIF